MGDYPKKIKDKMPLDKFKNYFVKTVYGVHKVLGKDGTDEVFGSEYIIARDIQDAYHACEYDYVSYILDIMRENIARAQDGNLREFRFPYYSLLMHLILYKNVGYISPDFIDQTSDLEGQLPMQLWTRVWDSNYHFSDAVSFFNNFSAVIMKMLDPGYFRAPEILKGLLRPNLLPVEKRIDHNWGDIFLFPTFSLMRVYGCPQPPHILQKIIPPRLGIIEFIWQLFMVNREYLGPKVHRGTFLCRCFKIGEFTIGKEALDLIHSFLHHYNFCTGPYRMYDPDGWMRETLKEIRNYVLPSCKELPHEDIIPNIVAEGEAADKLSKLDDVLRVEKELKRIDPNFTGFYMDVPYPQRIRKMVADHAEIMAKLLEGPIGEENIVCPDSPEPDV